MLIKRVLIDSLKVLLIQTLTMSALPILYVWLNLKFIHKEMMQNYRKKKIKKHSHAQTHTKVMFG